MVRSALLAIALSLSACAATAPVVKPPLAQSASNRDDRARAGMRAIDEGRFDEAIQIFDRLLAEDPQSLDYAYEKAFAYYGKRDYDAAVALLEPLREGQSSPHVFRLLGNAYDMRGETARALATYEEGQRRFPTVGFLHYDHGVALLGKNEPGAALERFLRAVELDPAHASSHVMIARLVAEVAPVFGIVHAETAMALAPGHQAVREMSQLIAVAYRKMIDEAKAGQSVPRTESPFINLFRVTLQALAEGGDYGTGLDDVARLRGAMLLAWVSSEETFEVPALIGWQAQVAEAGHLDAYSHWVLGVGDDSYKAWCAGHGEACDGFAAWFEKTDFKPAS